jgi:hypothetical protein
MYNRCGVSTRHSFPRFPHPLPTVDIQTKQTSTHPLVHSTLIASAAGSAAGLVVPAGRGPALPLVARGGRPVCVHVCGLGMMG